MSEEKKNNPEKIRRFTELKVIAYREFPILDIKKPLVIGAGETLRAKLEEKGMTSGEVTHFLKTYFGSYRYRKNALEAQYRYDLEGNEHSQFLYCQKVHLAQEIINDLNKKHIKANGRLSAKSLELVDLANPILERQKERAKLKKKRQRAARRLREKNSEKQ